MKKFSIFVLSILTLASCQQNNIWNDIQAGFQTSNDSNAYQSRCDFMLRQGRPVADIACLEAEDSESGCFDMEIPEGYSADLINADVLMNRSEVINKKLVLDGGMEYSLLILPQQEAMDLDLLECIYGLEKQGLIVAGSLPERSSGPKSGPEADARVLELCELMDPMTVSDGVFLATVLSNMGVEPDCFIGCDNLKFIHRTLGQEGDIYFISNQNEYQVDIYPEFRVEPGFSAQIWNPATGEIHAWKEESLELEALQSVFVVFRKD